MSTVNCVSNDLDLDAMTLMYEPDQVIPRLYHNVKNKVSVKVFKS